jgi:uridylate kinase
MQKNNYNINDIREFKLKFKNFLETISENFDQLALNIKNDYQITIDVTDIKEIYAYYRTLPNESD